MNHVRFFRPEFLAENSDPHTVDLSMYELLSRTRLMTVACARNPGPPWEPWAFTAFFAFDASACLHFLSPPDTRHSLALGVQDDVAFTVVDSQQTGDDGRRGLQGIGRCAPSEGEDMMRGLESYRSRFPATSVALASPEALAASGMVSRLWTIHADQVVLFDEPHFGEETWITVTIPRA